MRPFDLEAAKRGEPVEVLYRSEWVEAHFVGLDRHQAPVFEGEWDGFSLSTWRRENVRMAARKPPVKRTAWVNVYRARLDGWDGNDAAAFDTEEDARTNATDNHAGLAAIAVPIEIED
jgi:hypothetical protein